MLAVLNQVVRRVHVCVSLSSYDMWLHGNMGLPSPVAGAPAGARPARCRQSNTLRHTRPPAAAQE